MKVAWDLQAVTGPRPTGLGLAVRYLTEALEHHSLEIEVIGLRPNTQDKALSSVLDRMYWEQVRLPLALCKAKQRGAQVAFTPALGAPLLCPVPKTAYVHDIIPLKHPQHFTGPARWYWSTLLPKTWRNCQALAVSNHTVANELADFLHYPRERIHLVPYYIDPSLKYIATEIRERDELLRKTDKTDTMFLTVGSHEPRKNLVLAIRALAIHNKKHTPAKLVVTGSTNAYTETLRMLASELDVTEYVEFTGYIERRQLVRLMLTATALLFVSKEEGFGLPPLEAQSVGCPVILSDIPVLRAVHFDEARLSKIPSGLKYEPTFIPVDDVQALSDMMARYFTDTSYRTNTVKAGLAYSATFTSHDTASALTSMFQAAISK